MSYVKGLRCRECGAESPIAPLHVCETCFGPLEVVYDYAAIGRVLTRERIASRPRNLWRYRELLPIEGEPQAGLHSGFTPLVRADRLAAALGVRELYVKDDSVNHPTFSYKDRVVSVPSTTQSKPRSSGVSAEPKRSRRVSTRRSAAIRRSRSAATVTFGRPRSDES